MIKKVSIIIAAYNVSAYLDTTFKSIFNQTYENWEVVICDDCSTDNTLELCNKYSKMDNRILTYYNEKNIKQAATRNKCINFCTGDYIVILDADDEMTPDRIEKQVYYLEKNHHIGFVGSNAYTFSDSEKTGFISKPKTPSKLEVISNSGFIYATLMIRADLLKKVNGYTVSAITETGEDFDLVCKLYMQNINGENLKEYLYGYRVNELNYDRRKYKCYVDEFKVSMKYVKLGWFKKFRILNYKKCVLYMPLVKGLVPKKMVRFYHSIKFKKFI